MRDKFAYETALFIQDEWKVSERLLIKAGLRWSSFYRVGTDTILVYEDDAPIIYDPMLGQYLNGEVVDSIFYDANELVKGYSNLEPRLSIRYQLDDTRSIKASYQKINQYLHYFNTTYLFGKKIA